MEHEEYYDKFSSIISRFPEGFEEKYKTNPIANQIVQMLVRDVDPCICVSELIQIIENQQNFIEEKVKLGTFPIMYVPADKAKE